MVTFEQRPAWSEGCHLKCVWQMILDSTASRAEDQGPLDCQASPLRLQNSRPSNAWKFWENHSGLCGRVWVCPVPCQASPVWCPVFGPFHPCPGKSPRGRPAMGAGLWLRERQGLTGPSSLATNTALLRGQAQPRGLCHLLAQHSPGEPGLQVLAS